MPSTSIAFGTILIVIGLVGYVIGMMNDRASVTALIPAFFGIVLLLLGVFAQMRDGLRKHLMHVAVIVGLLGFILTAGRLVSRLSELTLSAAVLSQVAMAVVCLVFVILAVKSFAAARRSNKL